MEKCPYMTTAAGTPVPDNQNSQTAVPRGPVLCPELLAAATAWRFRSESSDATANQ